MKKMSNKGFTLIELLAVITIMGILMMVAIPAVSRTIENSRRDTFADTAGEYVDAVRKAVIADDIECYFDDGTGASVWRVASSLPDGVYYYPICTSSTAGFCEDADEEQLDREAIVQSTIDLMESGGKSPFGNADMFGYVTWTKETINEDEENAKSNTTYKVLLQDSGKHGLTAERSVSELKRSNVTTSISGDKKKNNIKTRPPVSELAADKGFAYCKMS